MTSEEIRDEFDRAVRAAQVEVLRLAARLRRIVRRIEVDPWRDLGGEA